MSGRRLNKKAAEKTLFRRFPESRAQSPAWKHEILTAIICWPCSSLILIQGLARPGCDKDWHDEIERLMEQLYDQVPEALAVRLETDRIAVCLPLGDEANRQVLEHEAAIRLPIRCTMGLSRRYNGMDKRRKRFEKLARAWRAYSSIEINRFFGQRSSLLPMPIWPRRRLLPRCIP